ncbi:MAG: LytR/AlgR family response regulator transcription factor [Saprospiraceae bacterium]
MLKAMIIDDEIKAVELLRSYLDKIDFITLAKATRNPLKAFNYLQEHPVDVLFLDINMPILSGVELLKSIRQPPPVIFTTAYPEYAVEGFNLEAIDYLLKPISFPRFLKACEKLLKRRTLESNAVETKVAYEATNLVYVKSGKTTHKLNWKDILYLEKDENYVIYHTPQKRILSRQTLSDLVTIFPSHICRIHKSYAVSLLHLQQIERSSLTVNNTVLPIGRTYRENFVETLQHFKQH